METPFIITGHFLNRMNQRGISQEMVELALRYGQKIWARDSLYFFMGKRQAQRFGKLAEKLEGLVVVIESRTKNMKTVFRNRRWLKKIRYKK